MPPSRASQKRQTRLTFTPVASPSPAAEASSSRIVSHVRYDSPCSNRLHDAFVRAKASDDAIGEATPARNDTSVQLQLPTPLKSSQTREQESVVSHEKSTDFNHSEKDPIEVLNQSEGESDDDVIASRLKRMRRSQAQDISKIKESEHDSDTVHVSSQPNRRVVKRNFDKETPTKRAGRLRGSRTSHETQKKQPKRLLRSTGKGAYREHAGDSPSPSKSASSVSDFGDPEATSDEDVKMVTKPTARRGARKSLTDKDNFVVGDDTIELITSEEDGPLTQQARRGRTKNGRSAESIRQLSEKSENDPVITPSKRKRNGRLVRSSQKPNKQEELDIKEDLEDLSDSAIHTSRTRGAPVNSARAKYRQGLEALKRSRARLSSPLGSHREFVDSDSDLEIIHPEGDGDTEEQPSVGRGFHALSDNDLSASSQSERPDSDEDLNQYEDDFVEEDGDVGPLDLPLEFSHWATAPVRTHFRNVVQWLVKNKIAPAFERSHELFELSFRKVDDEVKGQAGSRFISSAWKSHFKYALEARPELEIVRITTDGDGESWWEDCEACGRSGHPATWSFQLKGDAYYSDNLEPVGEVESSDEEDEDANSSAGSASDSLRPSYDSHGNLLPPVSHLFPLGRKCAADASTAHKLLHWKFHLNQYILSLLRSNGVLSPERIVERDSKSQRKREKEADSIVDELDASGEMEELWKLFKLELESARDGMEGWEDRSSSKVGGAGRRATGKGGGRSGRGGIWGL